MNGIAPDLISLVGTPPPVRSPPSPRRVARTSAGQPLPPSSQPLLRGQPLPPLSQPPLRGHRTSAALPSAGHPMSQDSWTPGCSGLAGARVRRGSLEPWLGGATPLEVMPPVDEVTVLPLIMCPNCKHLKLTAFTCKWTDNRGERYFKCPRNDDKFVDRCRIIMNQKQYELHLVKNGYLQPASIVDDVSTMVLEEIEQVELRVTKMKEELAMIKLGMEEMKNKEQRSCTWRLVVLVVVMFVVSISLKK